MFNDLIYYSVNHEALEDLMLWSDMYIPEHEGISFMSDLLISQGLMKIPKLRQLRVYWRFQVCICKIYMRM